jgi:asparagine N-glycosylation enzyme membrane subunit Stt3
MDSDEIVRERKEKLLQFLKQKTNWIIYLALAVVVGLGVWIRTRNLSGLRDITTGGWTLGPDLDPFLFLRYAKEIVAQGTLSAVDTMRYVPLGLDVQSGHILHFYMIAWFHKIASFFGSSSVNQSAVIFPVVMFGMTMISFFLLTRLVLSSGLESRSANIGAIIATLFFGIFPVFLPRTIAGIPEKESSAFFFLFMALYLFVKGWDETRKPQTYVFSALAALFTSAMALIWGAYSYIFFILAPTTFFIFLVRSLQKKQVVNYSIWLLGSMTLMGIITKWFILTSKILFTKKYLV